MRMFAYFMFCETQRCRQIADYLRITRGLTCISPEIVQRKWVKGIQTEEKHDWLPGYLFVYTEDSQFQRPNINGIIRILGNGPLTGQDLQFAVMLHHRNGIMGSLTLVQEGDRCIVSDPAWDGLNGIVIKMDRGRKRCCIEYQFDSETRTIWVGYELVRMNTEECL